MNFSIQELKNQFINDINSLKEKVNQILDNANENDKNFKSLNIHTEAELKTFLNEVNEKLTFKKKALRDSIEAFEHNRSSKYAIRRAECSQDYAFACIELAQESVLEAELAIMKAIDTATEADALKKNLK